MLDAIVIGGGISGLVCAYELKRQGRNVVLVESSLRLGGAMHSEAVDGFLFERGPTSFLETPALHDLISRLGMVEEVVAADSGLPRYVYFKGKLRPVPMGPLSFLTTRLLSSMGKLRLLAEPFIPSQAGGDELSIKEFVTRRLGKEVHDVLVGPFISGVYAGDTAQLSASAASPFSRLVEFEAEYGSILRGALAARGGNTDGRKRRHRLCSFRQGLEALPRKIARELINETLVGSKVRGIEFHNHAPQSYFTVQVDFAGDIQPLHAATLIVATPAFAAAKLLDPLSDRLGTMLNEIEHPPLASVSLAYPENRVAHSLHGFGFLAPRTEGIRTLGTVWSSSLFRWRAPQGRVLLTSYIGGSTDPNILDLSDADIVKAVDRDLNRVLGVSVAPTVLGVTRWERCIPQYTLGYGERKKQIETLAGRYPGLFLAGNYLSGVSLGDCVAWSNRTVGQVAEYLARTSPPSTGVTPSTRTGSDLLM